MSECPDLASLAATEDRTHVEACPACRARLERFSEIVGALPGKVEPPAHVLPSLLEKIDHELARGARESAGVGEGVVMSGEPIASLGGQVAEPPAGADAPPRSGAFGAGGPAAEEPKTISQREAEDIIRRITARPAAPEVPAPPIAQLTPRRSSFPRLAAAVLLLVGSAAAAVVLDAPPKTVAVTPVEARIRAKVLESEWRAFGFQSAAEFEASLKEGHR